MLFSHLLFLYVFMPVLFLAYFVIKNNTWRRIVLTVFSLLFYAWGEPVAIFLMIGLVLGDYLFGLLIDHVYTAMAKRLWLIAAIVFNLSILGVYKYLGFFTETFNLIFHAQVPVISLTMPIGISFFTFQTMSYVIDVYRDDAKVQKSFFSLLLYVSFFPQLIAWKVKNEMPMGKVMLGTVMLLPNSALMFSRVNIKYLKTNKTERFTTAVIISISL